MDKKLSEHIYFALVITDFDYIAVRHLMAGALFPSAGSLANVVMDRYIKIALMSAGRNDLIDVIKKYLCLVIVKKLIGATQSIPN